MDEQALINTHINDEVILTAFTGEEILYKFIGEDNVTYVVLRKKDEDEAYHYAVLPIAYFSFPAEINEIHMGFLKSDE